MNPVLIKQIVEDKKNGHSDEFIGKKYGVNFKFIEKAITMEQGINISSLNQKKKKNIQLEPENFKLENTTVWSFKSRGSWATHNGNYRGNWSPYIPRNMILKYSKENDLVLDYFCGAGTTAVEAKLLNRNFVGIDINPNAIQLANENINFKINNNSGPPSIKLKVGDARDLSGIKDESIDLICAHPPYADIIQYTHNNDKDLSSKNVPDFLVEMKRVAVESYRVLKEGHHCVILIGDMRKNKNVIPLGFWTIEKFIETGFKIKELIIKRQHNCKTTGFWYDNSIKFNFLLLAHEYLVVFEKTEQKIGSQNFKEKIKLKISIDDDVYLETTTVWLFDSDTWLNKTLSNLVRRYSAKEYLVFGNKRKNKQAVDLLVNFNNKIEECVEFAGDCLKNKGMLVFVAEDKRTQDGLIYSLPLEIEKRLRNNKKFKIKELVIVSVEDNKIAQQDNKLKIIHKYLLIYERV